MPLGLGSGVALPSKLLCEEPELGGIGAVNSPGDDGQGSVCKMSPGSMDGDGIARGPGTPRVTVPRWGARTSGVKRLAPAVEAWSGVQGTGRTSNAFSRACCSRLVALLCRRSHLRAAATKRRGRHHSGKPRQQANALEKRAHRRGERVLFIEKRRCALHHLQPPHMIQSNHASSPVIAARSDSQEGGARASSTCVSLLTALLDVWVRKRAEQNKTTLFFAGMTGHLSFRSEIMYFCSGFTKSHVFISGKKKNGFSSKKQSARLGKGGFPVT